MHTLKVSPGAANYNVYIGSGALRDISSHLKHARMSNRLVLITNPFVFELHGYNLKEALAKDGFEVDVLTVPDGEEYKSLEAAGGLYDGLSAALVERRTPVLALGGGVIGDLAGFVAATYMRGMPLIQIPTTLLAQVDSSIGGKTAVNHGKLKNQIGVFYQPAAVFSDTAVLKTLAASQLSNGLAEVIKSAVIGDRLLFGLLERRMTELKYLDEKTLETAILRAAAVKARIVSRDERDRGLRNMLNFGHTVGHAIEAVTGFKVNHGTAVAVGMVTASRIACRMGLFPDRDLKRLMNIITAAGLPITMPELKIADVLEAIKHDKKVSGGRTKFILPVRIGQVIITDKVDLAMVAEALAE
ncbi:MAG: 3-dehydroquinate synthase [Dehalococcoidia bacterium]|nr:MAG: 3-dehydroquinate synthase [Dehalococcoidia bacterium]